MLVADLEAPGWRAWWPGFAVAGVAAGAAAVFAFPLVQGAIRVGVLGLYRETPGSLSPGALADVLVCADAALLLLLNSRAGVDGNGDGWVRTACPTTTPGSIRRRGWCPHNAGRGWRRHWPCCAGTRSCTT